MNGAKAYDIIIRQRINRRLKKQNKNWIACICGEPGSGKSYAALVIAKDINSKVHLVFSPIEFMELLVSDNLKAGEVILFDEAGVGMAARDWQQVQNKLMGSILQTFRHKNLAVIFTTPNLSFVDVQARKLLQCYMETRFIDFKNGINYLNILNIEIHSRQDEIFFKNPVVYGKEHYPFYVNEIGVPLPDAETIKWYEEKKQAFTKSLNEKALNDLQAKVEIKKPNPDSVIEKVSAVVKEVLARREEFTRHVRGRTFIDEDLIALKFSLPARTSQKVKKIIEKEQYDLLGNA